jgi:RecB family exonuclease
LADQLVSAVTPSDFDQHAVLIPDIPSIRRSLKRALEMRGIPLAEPRDPTQLQWDESLKQALLPLQVVARQFDRQKVIAWLRTSPVRDPGQVSAWVEEMNSRGIRSGLSSYAGGVLQDLYLELCELLKVLGGRKTAPEVGEKHLEILRGLDKKDVTRQKMASFFEGSWATFAQDLERTGQEKRRASLLYWLERIESRLGEASPPVDPLKPQFGVRLYRLQQAPVLPATQVWLFGIPPRWLRGEGTGDLWFSERDREILASEFAIRSWVQVREERLKILHFWMARSEQWTLLDAEFDAEGRERESLFPFLREFGLSLGLNLPESPKVQGAHFRTARSYGSVRPLQPVYVGLPPTTPSATGHPPELSATLLDRASRCSFQGLAFHRWKLKDVREPKTELWPDVRGNILHEAVRIILQSLSSEGQFGVLPKEALLQAWKAKGPKGLIQTPRVVNYAFSRMERILEVFCEKERDYLKKSQVIPLSLDEMTLRLHYPTFSIRGQPDRIDQSQQGIFIIDYKSSGGIPHGTDMIEQAYRLQLPFYAIAAARQLNQDVLGVQFVELDKKGGRKSGILFKEFNGKEPGKLTQLRANSKSLISIPREEVWAHLEAALIRTAEAYLRGEFEAVPRTVPAYKECTACRLQDLCGFKRRTDSV